MPIHLKSLFPHYQDRGTLLALLVRIVATHSFLGIQSQFKLISNPLKLEKSELMKFFLPLRCEPNKRGKMNAEYFEEFGGGTAGTPPSTLNRLRGHSFQGNIAKITSSLIIPRANAELRVKAL